MFSKGKCCWADRSSEILINNTLTYLGNDNDEVTFRDFMSAYHTRTRAPSQPADSAKHQRDALASIIGDRIL